MYEVCWNIRKGEIYEMATTDIISVYTVLEKLIKHFEKLNVDIKIINILKECKDLNFLK